MKRLNIEMDDKLFKEFKVKSIKEELTMTDIVTALIEDYINENELETTTGMSEKAKETRADYMRRYMKEYRAKNKEKLSDYQKTWRKENKQKVRKYNENFWNKKGALANENLLYGHKGADAQRTD